MTLDIYVVEHPRSGATWLQRLLSDILKAELVSGITDQGVYDSAYWGEGEPEDNYRIFKSHSLIRQGKTIYVYRDPRDVLVSAWHYTGQTKGRSLYETLKRYILEEHYLPNEATYGKYEAFVRTWWNTGLAEATVRYEDLHIRPIPTIDRAIYLVTGRRVSAQAINNAYWRHEFGAELARRPELYHSMWKGKIGTWREHFTKREADFMQHNLGDLMMEQGYISGPDWTHEVGVK